MSILSCENSTNISACSSSVSGSRSTERSKARADRCRRVGRKQQVCWNEGGGGITDSSLTGTALETRCETFFATTLRKVWKGFSQKEAVAIRVTPRRERKKKKRHSSEEEVKVRRAGVSLYSDHIQAHDSKFCGLSLLLLEIPRKLMTWNLIVSLQGKVLVHYLIPDTEQHKDLFVYMI